jgi:hypothetical protein
MFYSRPAIKPLNWDLEKLPEGQDFTFESRTTDGYPVSFKYRGGWIQAWRGDKGATESAYTNSMLEQAIGPPAHWGILPEQICDLLGMTVQGQKVVVPEEKRIEQGLYDWSGKTTYWRSQHYVLQRDTERLVQDIVDQFFDVTLLQSFLQEDLKTWRNRRIDFFSNEDRHVLIGVGAEKDRLSLFLNNDAGWKLHGRFHVLPFDFWLFVILENDRPSPLGKDLINNNGAAKLDLKYNMQGARKLSLSTEFKTDSAKAQECMQKILPVIERHFSEGVEALNLQSGASVKLETGDFSYSKTYNDWCLEKDQRFLAVGVLGKDEEKVFYGLRPAQKSKSWLRRFLGRD